MATTLVVSLLLPKSYRASASVVIDFKPDPISAAFDGVTTPPAVMATQADIIKSERVALRVVRNLKLTESPQVRIQWEQDTKGEGTIEQSAARRALCGYITEVDLSKTVLRQCSV